MKREAVRHHYIPQFIIRNFCFCENGKVHFHNKYTNQDSDEDTRNVFMAKNLYRDEINAPKNPTQIESDMSILEREASNILKKKFLEKKEFIITQKEDELLRIFFAVMGFRSDRVKNSFIKESNNKNKLIFANYQWNRNYEDFWKRNLGFLINCRTIKEVMEHPNIDDPIKVFFHRDTNGFMGLHFAVAERCEDIEFVIGDAYPVLMNGAFPNGCPAHAFSIFPLSPNRVVFIVEDMAEQFICKTNFGIRPCVVRSPKKNNDGTYTIRVKKIFNDEVSKINSNIIKESQTGYIYKKKW